MFWSTKNCSHLIPAPPPVKPKPKGTTFAEGKPEGKKTNVYIMCMLLLLYIAIPRISMQYYQSCMTVAILQIVKPIWLFNSFSYTSTVSMHMRDLFVGDVMDQSMPYVWYAQEPIYVFSIDPNFESKVSC